MSAATQPARERVRVTHVYNTEDRSFTGAQLLRLFDQARRDLSVRLTGTEGSGAGYDGLRLEAEALASVELGDLVTVTAMVGALRGRRHMVDYIAVVRPAGHVSSVATKFLGQAHGWTVATATPHSVMANTVTGRRTA